MKLKEAKQRAAIPAEMERIATAIVDAAYVVHSKLGPGLLESVYEACLARELEKRNLIVQRQVVVPIVYDGIQIENAFKLDLLVGGCLVVELKALDSLLPVHFSQLLTYLKLTGRRIGLLINFNVPLIKDGIRRVVF